jgi:hypothetical protein
MAKGGARNRSGPPKQEDSARSEALGFELTALPAKGYTGRIPKFPLPPRMVYAQYWADGERVVELDVSASDHVADRERELWAWAWRTPQACAWSMPSESWRLHTVAMWVRTFVLCESAEATAADKNSLHRFADQIGLTPAGLRENGWKVAVDELAQQRRKAAPAKAPPPRQRRLRAVNDDGGQ